MPITPQLLQETNGKLHRLLELMQQQESGPIRVNAVDLAGLLSELQRVAQLRKAKSKKPIDRKKSRLAAKSASRAQLPS